MWSWQRNRVLVKLNRILISNASKEPNLYHGTASACHIATTTTLQSFVPMFQSATTTTETMRRRLLSKRITQLFNDLHTDNAPNICGASNNWVRIGTFSISYEESGIRLFPDTQYSMPHHLGANHWSAHCTDWLTTNYTNGSLSGSLASPSIWVDGNRKTTTADWQLL